MTDNKRSTTNKGTETPILRILSVEDLLPHENHDSQRLEPLVGRIKEERILMNPPVVTPITGTEKYMVLDGANRVSAMIQLGIPHMLTQVVRYESPIVRLDTWNHVITNADTDKLAKNIAKISGIVIEETTHSHAQAILIARTILAYLVLPDGTIKTIIGGGLDIRARTALLHNIADSYMSFGQLHRAKTDDLSELLEQFPAMTLAIVYPKYEPVEVMDLVSRGMIVPSGITRHIVSGRALRINYPLSELESPDTLEIKNQRLTLWMQKRFEDRGVRYYAESTYLFDE